MATRSWAFPPGSGHAGAHGHPRVGESRSPVIANTWSRPESSTESSAGEWAPSGNGRGWVCVGGGKAGLEGSWSVGGECLPGEAGD